MKLHHYEHFLAATYMLECVVSADDSVMEGRLIPRRGGDPIPIIHGIPRFVRESNYADNFGLQWNIFRSTQLDSMTGLPLTANRFWQDTGWTQEELHGSSVLEVGSGAGRFTEILLQTGASVTSFDYSCAVDANYTNNMHKGDLFLFQGDLYDMPLADNSFDYVFCYGVLQHTPRLEDAFRAMFAKLRPGGKLSLDCYRRYWFPTPWTTPKYLWRPITKRMNPDRLLSVIRKYMCWYLPFDTLIRRIPFLGPAFLGLMPIPCWNYVGIGLTNKQRLEWAVMDTFDALGATYDYPKTKREVERMILTETKETAIVRYGSNGIVANLIRARTIPSSGQS